MTTDLRPEALLALADRLAWAEPSDDLHALRHEAAATLRALAAQPAWQAGFEEGRKRERAMWEMTRAGEAIEAELSPQTETPPESDWAMYLRNSAKSVEEDRANYVYLLPRECRAIADALAAPSQTETPPESDWAMYLRNSAKSVEEDRANYVYLLPRECRAIADALAAPSHPMAGEPVALLREVTLLREALADIAANGCRHDLNPTMPLYGENWQLAARFTEYIKSMDQFVREKARAALAQHGDET
jgi:hypothetical protein